MKILRQISLADFYILYYLFTYRESRVSDIYKYVSQLIPMTRQTFSYKIKTLYTKDHLVKESYVNTKCAGKLQTTTYYELTDIGIGCYKETKQTLLAILIQQ